MALKPSSYLSCIVKGAGCLPLPGLHLEEYEGADEVDVGKLKIRES